VYTKSYNPGVSTDCQPDAQPYKHLPFFQPGASFVFFLNPHAGRAVKLADGRFTVYDVETGDYFAHHSRLATADYLRRFGHWDYWVDENPRIQDGKRGRGFTDLKMEAAKCCLSN
jgi:hypothetical protein